MSLIKESYFSLRTFRKTGVAVDTPVWFASVNNSYMVFSAKQAGKVKRIRNNSTVQIAACTVNGKLTGDWQEATARCVEEATLIDQTYQALQQKYGLQMRFLNLLSWLSGKIKHRQVIEITPAS